MSKTDSGGTTSYKRAGAYVTDSLLKSTVSSTTTDYTPGVSSRVGSDSTFLHSGIKNADTQTDDGGDVSAMRRYDAFGNPVAAWGGWQGPLGYGGPYGYQTDPDHGLMLLGHRYYEADTGRFLTRDPIKDGRNWYGYSANNPANRADPTGLRLLGDSNEERPWLGAPGTGRGNGFLRYLWTFPNQAIGAILAIGGVVDGYDVESDSIKVRGGWFSRVTENYVTVGDIINTPLNYDEDNAPWAHERVHRDHSDKLGPIYVPAHLAGYVIGAGRVVIEMTLDPYLDSPGGKRGLQLMHDASPLEMDADARSGDIEDIRGNPFTRRWLHAH